MTGPWPDIARTYDAVAEDYAAAFAGELEHKPLDRDLLDRFAAAVAGQGVAWDVGCGPAGQVTRYLADRGAGVVGADLSPAAMAVAARLEPGLRFLVADMRRLPARDRSLAGIVAFYSVIHLPWPQVAAALAEFRRVVAHRGVLLIAMHGGAGEDGRDDWFGRAVTVRVTLTSMAELTAALSAAGFTVLRQFSRDPYPGEYPARRLYVWARAEAAVAL